MRFINIAISLSLSKRVLVLTLDFDYVQLINTVTGSVALGWLTADVTLGLQDNLTLTVLRVDAIICTSCDLQFHTLSYKVYLSYSLIRLLQPFRSATLSLAILFSCLLLYFFCKSHGMISYSWPLILNYSGFLSLYPFCTKFHLNLLSRSSVKK